MDPLNEIEGAIEFEPGAQLQQIQLQPAIKRATPRTKELRETVVQSIKSEPREQRRFSRLAGMSIVFTTLFTGAENLAKKIQNGEVTLTADTIRWLSKKQIQALKLNVDISKLQDNVQNAIAYGNKKTARRLTELLTDDTFTENAKIEEKSKQFEVFQKMSSAERLHFMATGNNLQNEKLLNELKDYEKNIIHALYSGEQIQLTAEEKDLLNSSLQSMNDCTKIAFMGTWNIKSLQQVQELGLKPEHMTYLSIACHLAGKEFEGMPSEGNLDVLNAILSPLTLEQSLVVFKSWNIHPGSTLFQLLDVEHKIAIDVIKNFPLNITERGIVHLKKCLKLLPYKERMDCLKKLQFNAELLTSVDGFRTLIGTTGIIEWRIARNNYLEKIPAKERLAYMDRAIQQDNNSLMLFDAKFQVEWKISHYKTINEIVDFGNDSSMKKFLPIFNNYLDKMSYENRLKYMDFTIPHDENALKLFETRFQNEYKEAVARQVEGPDKPIGEPG